MAWLKAGDWIDLGEAAEIIGVTNRRLQAIIQRDKTRLPSATLIGKSYVLLRAEVEEFAKQPRAPGRPKMTVDPKPTRNRKPS